MNNYLEIFDFDEYERGLYTISHGGRLVEYYPHEIASQIPEDINQELTSWISVYCLYNTLNYINNNFILYMDYDKIIQCAKDQKSSLSPEEVYDHLSIINTALASGIVQEIPNSDTKELQKAIQNKSKEDFVRMIRNKEDLQVASCFCKHITPSLCDQFHGKSCSENINNLITLYDKINSFSRHIPSPQRLLDELRQEPNLPSNHLLTFLLKYICNKDYFVFLKEQQDLIHCYKENKEESVSSLISLKDIILNFLQGRKEKLSVSLKESFYNIDKESREFLYKFRDLFVSGLVENYYKMFNQLNEEDRKILHDLRHKISDDPIIGKAIQDKFRESKHKEKSIIELVENNIATQDSCSKEGGKVTKYFTLPKFLLDKPKDKRIDVVNKIIDCLIPKYIEDSSENRSILKYRINGDPEPEVLHKIKWKGDIKNLCYFGYFMRFDKDKNAKYQLLQVFFSFEGDFPTRPSNLQRSADQDFKNALNDAIF